MKSRLSVSIENANAGTTEYFAEGSSLDEARDGLIKKLLYVADQARRAERAATQAINTLEEKIL